MRMHKKGHLEERLVNCGDIITLCDLTNKNMKTAAEEKAYLNLENIFKNSNPVHLEVGCGKGKFVCGLAQIYPDLNFVAIEKVSNVIIDACEQARALNLKNVHFLNSSAEVLLKYFQPASFEKIYLNFSNPLPKEGYKKQRLTHPKFLRIYRALLKECGEIVQKTDDESFFDFSLESYAAENMKIIEICRDYSTPAEGDIETEHEARFKAEGKKIYRAVVRV